MVPMLNCAVLLVLTGLPPQHCITAMATGSGGAGGEREIFLKNELQIFCTIYKFLMNILGNDFVTQAITCILEFNFS